MEAGVCTGFAVRTVPFDFLLFIGTAIIRQTCD
jgi:hypothetical protein